MALGPNWGKNSISGRGQLSLSPPFFTHLHISARFPFYTRPPDSQSLKTYEQQRDQADSKVLGSCD